MTSSRVLQLLFLISSMTAQMIGMMPVEEKKEIGEGIAQKIAELPKELQYKIFPLALELELNPKYEVYRKFDVGSQVRGIALNADNTRALAGLHNGKAYIWDVEKGEVLTELKGDTRTVNLVALSADGKIAVTGSWDEGVRVWNALTGELINIFKLDFRAGSAALSADGSRVLIGAHDRDISPLYNALTGELINNLEVGWPVRSVALSADGTLALTGSPDGMARVWDTNTGKLIKNLPAAPSVSLVALSADGAIAVTVTIEKKILVWNIKSGVLLNTLLPKNFYIYSVALSKDGKRAFVGTDDGKIEIWNTQSLAGQTETSTPLTVLEGHTGAVVTLAVGDYDFIASGSHDKTALIWKPYVLEPRGPQENVEILRKAYKEIFSRPILRSSEGD